MLHAKGLHGNPYDGHTLGPVIADLQKLTGVDVQRIHVDKGYRGHSYPNRFRVWISGQVRRVTKTVRREMKRRAAAEPVIGHLKAEHGMARDHLKGRVGDRINPVLPAAGFNFHLLLRWFERLLRALMQRRSGASSASRNTLEPARCGKLHGRLKLQRAAVLFIRSSAGTRHHIRPQPRGAYGSSTVDFMAHTASGRAVVVMSVTPLEPGDLL